MIVLAIDPGFDKLGYAFFEFNTFPQKNYKFITSGLIKSNPKDSIEKRLNHIYQTLSVLIKKINPNLIVIEQIFFLKNKKTIIQVSQAQGVILLLAAQNKIKIKFITPLQIKQVITGYGHSDKQSIKKMLTLTNKIPSIREDDETDAIACGLAYFYLN